MKFVNDVVKEGYVAFVFGLDMKENPYQPEDTFLLNQLMLINILMRSKIRMTLMCEMRQALLMISLHISQQSKKNLTLI
jgi:hypothetical protein